MSNEDILETFPHLIIPRQPGVPNRADNGHFAEAELLIRDKTPYFTYV